MIKTNQIIRILSLMFLFLSMQACGLNNIPTYDEASKSAWGQVENQYQRRMALMDQAVATVRAGANYEKSTLEAVVQARASATQIKVDASNLSPEAIQRFDPAVRIQRAQIDSHNDCIVVIEC